MKNKKQINAYKCPNNHITVTVNKNTGTTPLYIDCPECHQSARSKFFQVSQSLIPTHEWYKPSVQQMQQHAQEAVGNGLWQYPIILSAILHHVHSGGLCIRKINQPAQP